MKDRKKILKGAKGILYIICPNEQQEDWQLTYKPTWWEPGDGRMTYWKSYTKTTAKVEFYTQCGKNPSMLKAKIKQFIYHKNR